MRELTQVSLASKTTLQLGGLAARWVEADTERELEEAVRAVEDRGEPLLILGGGSNVVVDDAGWPGTVLQPSMRGIETNVGADTCTVTASAGVTWDDLVAETVERGWAGLECLSGIPGMVGAAPMQNIGAYGQEIADTLVSVRAWDRSARAWVEVAASECGFDYRTSTFKGKEQHVIAAVTLSLIPGGDSRAIRYAELARALDVTVGSAAPVGEVRQTILALRRSKGMVVDPNDPESRSAGSFFVNVTLSQSAFEALEQRVQSAGILTHGERMPRYPASSDCVKVPSAWLIERAGFRKGHTRNGAGISSKHALALVNRGGTTRDLLQLAEEIRGRVMESFGVELTREPVLVIPPRSSNTLPGASTHR